LGDHALQLVVLGGRERGRAVGEARWHAPSDAARRWWDDGLQQIPTLLMVNPQTLADGDHSVFVSGNDADAKKTVARLVESFGHTDIVDLGDITTARGTEMLLPLWLRLMGALNTPMFNLKVVR